MTKEEFARNIKILNDLMPKHAKLETEEEIEGYYQNLKDLSIDSFSRAIGEILLLQKSFYNFPSIREIREKCYQYDKKAILLNKVFQRILLDAIIHENMPNNYQDLIIQSINHIKGWKSLKDIQDNEKEKEEKKYQFITFYLKNKNEIKGEK